MRLYEMYDSDVIAIMHWTPRRRDGGTDGVVLRWTFVVTGMMLILFLFVFQRRSTKKRC